MKKCRIKNEYIYIEKKIDDGIRAVGLRVKNKFRLNTTIPHKKLSIYMTDVLPPEDFKELKIGKVENSSVFFHHSVLVIELPEEKGNLKSISIENLSSSKALYKIKVLKFQSIMEKWINSVYREWIQIYSKIKKSAKKDIKKRKNAIREFLIEDMVQNYKKYRVGNKLLAFISLVLNTGDIYYSFLRNKNKLPDLEDNIPWIMNVSDTKQVIKPNDIICNDLITIAVNLADVVYEFMKDKSKLEKIIT